MRIIAEDIFCITISNQKQITFNFFPITYLTCLNKTTCYKLFYGLTKNSPLSVTVINTSIVTSIIIVITI